MPSLDKITHVFVTRVRQVFAHGATVDSVVKSKLLFIHQIICNPSIESMIQLLSEMHFLVSGILLMINLKHPTIFSWESFVVLSVFINLEGLFVCSKRTKIWQLWGGRELCGLLLFPPFLLPLDTRGAHRSDTKGWKHKWIQMSSSVLLAVKAGRWGYSSGVSRDLFCLWNEVREQGSAGELSCWDSGGVVFQWKDWI